MLVLVAPWVLLLLSVISVVFLLRKKWKWGGTILIITLILNYSVECIPFRICCISATRGNNNILKVMTYNINGANEDFKERSYQICQLIKATDSDVVFIAEFPEQDPLLFDSLLRQYFPYRSSNSFKWMHYFYSKYPLSQQRRLRDKNNNEIGAYVCSVFTGKDTIELCGCHLSSNNYTKDKEYVTPDSINSHSKLKLYLIDINRAYEKRSKEAEIIAEYLHDLTKPGIIMGDFNDIGGSSALKNIEKEGIKDAWTEGGFGYGATIHNPLTYRIDHIMYTQELDLCKIEVVNSKGLSDHDALYSEIGY